MFCAAARFLFSLYVLLGIDLCIILMNCVQFGLRRLLPRNKNGSSAYPTPAVQGQAGNRRFQAPLPGEPRVFPVRRSFPHVSEAPGRLSAPAGNSRRGCRSPPRRHSAGAGSAAASALRRQQTQIVRPRPEYLQHSKLLDLGNHIADFEQLLHRVCQKRPADSYASSEKPARSPQPRCA